MHGFHPGKRGERRRMEPRLDPVGRPDCWVSVFPVCGFRESRHYGKFIPHLKPRAHLPFPSSRPQPQIPSFLSSSPFLLLSSSPSLRNPLSSTRSCLLSILVSIFLLRDRLASVLPCHSSRPHRSHHGKASVKRWMVSLPRHLCLILHELHTAPVHDWMVGWFRSIYLALELFLGESAKQNY